MSSLTKRELRAADKLGAMLPQLHDKDIVFAVLPDGSKVLVKGSIRLSRIIAIGNSESSAVAFVPVLSVDAAAALEQVLGGDGFYSRPGTAGHA